MLYPVYALSAVGPDAASLEDAHDGVCWIRASWGIGLLHTMGLYINC